MRQADTHAVCGRYPTLCVSTRKPVGALAGLAEVTGYARTDRAEVWPLARG